ncbi:MAG: hypothetical protein ABTQ32_30130 [Myxococcaceae bacterium]
MARTTTNDAMKRLNSYASPAGHTSSISTDGTSWSEIPTLMNQQANTILDAPTHQRFYAVFGTMLGELRDGQMQWAQVAGVDTNGLSGITVKNDSSASAPRAPTRAPAALGGPATSRTRATVLLRRGAERSRLASRRHTNG